MAGIDPTIVEPNEVCSGDGTEVPPVPRIPDIDDVTPEYQDQYIGAEVVLPLQGEMKRGKVKERSRTEAGELYGTANTNPILDSRSYEVEFPDGTVTPYTANIIASHMISQCDADGHTTMLMDEIVDVRTDGAEVKHAGRYVKRGNNRHLRKTTKGYKLCIKWKAGSTSWERLADLKESYPLQVAEFAAARGIIHQPAFAWWAPYVLKKRDRIIATAKRRAVKRTHKFGIEIPTTVKRALEIDKENGNTLWQDALEKEMRNVRIAFRILADGEKVPVGSQEMDCHLIFDVKLELDAETGLFRRKVRLVAGGHQTRQPLVPTYASVVSRDTVRIALTYAALNGLEAKASDIKNAFVTAPCEEIIHTVLGPEFGPDEGKTAIITRALYGLKSAAASFNRHLASCMRQLGYQCCKADADLWIKRKVRPDDGKEYYSYVLLYVDDCLCIDHDAESVLRELDRFFPMKAGSIGGPDAYLGAKLRKVQLNNGVNCWSMPPTKYVQEAVKNF